MVNSNESRAVLEEKYFLNVNFGHVDKKQPGWCSGCMLPSGSSGTNNHNWKRWSVQFRYRADGFCCFFGWFWVVTLPSTGFSLFFWLIVFSLSFHVLSVIQHHPLSILHKWSLIQRSFAAFCNLKRGLRFFSACTATRWVCKIWDWTVEGVVKWLGVVHQCSEPRRCNATARVWLVKLVYFFWAVTLAVIPRCTSSPLFKYDEPWR